MRDLTQQYRPFTGRIKEKQSKHAKLIQAASVLLDLRKLPDDSPQKQEALDNLQDQFDLIRRWGDDTV